MLTSLAVNNLNLIVSICGLEDLQSVLKGINRNQSFSNRSTQGRSKMVSR